MRDTFRDPELQQSLERDGYAVLPLLDHDEVARLRAAYEDLGQAPGDPHLACQSSFHSYDKDYKLNVDRAVKDVLQPHLDEVFDDQRTLPANFIVKWPSAMSGFGLHQDLTLVDEHEFRSVEVWVALDDTNERNGQLWMVPGSHTWLPDNIRGIQAFPFPFTQVTRRIIERHAVPVPIPAGHAIVFTHATLHFSLPNRTEQPRMVAICDLIPAEAPHLHYFGDGNGHVDQYEIDDTFWTDNNPFTLWKPPPSSQLVGPVSDEYYRELTDDDLDRLVASGKAIESEQSPAGAMNAAKAWCHRCGAAVEDAPAPDRWVGNVTLICDDCRTAESTRAATPEHTGVAAS